MLRVTALLEGADSSERSPAVAEFRQDIDPTIVPSAQFSRPT
jgi:hypothetical protein